MTTPSTSTDSEETQDTTTTPDTVPAPGIEQFEDDDFDSDAERRSYAHDYPSQAREADLGGRHL